MQFQLQLLMKLFPWEILTANKESYLSFSLNGKAFRKQTVKKENTLMGLHLSTNFNKGLAFFRTNRRRQRSILSKAGPLFMFLLGGRPVKVFSLSSSNAPRRSVFLCKLEQCPERACLCTFFRSAQCLPHPTPSPFLQLDRWMDGWMDRETEDQCFPTMLKCAKQDAFLCLDRSAPGHLSVPTMHPHLCSI